MLCSLLQFRFQHAHLCRRHIALLHHRIGDELQEQCDENQHDTHVDVQSGEEVEHVDSEPSVDDAEEWPTEVDEALHVEILVECALLFNTLQQTEVVRTIVEVKLRRSLSAWVEEGLHLGLILLQIARALLLRNACHLRILGEVVLGNHHSREELVLESHPVNLLLDGLVLNLLAFRQVVGATLSLMIGQSSIAVLECESALLLTSHVLPLYIHLCCRRGESASQSYCLHLSVQHIVLAQHIVDYERLAGTSHSGHSYCRVGLV